MKKIFLLIITVAICLNATAQPMAADRKYGQKWVSERYDKKDVMVTMRDGVKLYTIIYEPKDKSVKHPVLMERTGYNIGPYGEGRYRNLESYAPYLEAGYIFVFQDVRGKNMSEGEFEDIRPFIEGKKLNKKAAKNVGQTDEASDTYDTVEWIVNNTNNNGCVGQKGISYPGFYSTMAALSGHPAMKAVSPQAPVTDWWHGDDAHHNGAFMMAEMMAFFPGFEYRQENKYYQNPNFSAKLPNLRPTDIYSDYLRMGTISDIRKAYADSVTYFRTLSEHPDYDEYWESHTVTNGHLHDVMPAVMVVGGLFDKEDCYGALDTYKSMREQSPATELYLVEGPWYHGAWARGMTPVWNYMYFGDEATSEYYMENIEYPFFAYYLEGKGSKPEEGALIFDSGSRSWKHYDRQGWPEVKRSDATPFYLTADGDISTVKPSGNGSVGYVSDPSKPVPYHMGAETRITPNYMIADQRFAAQRPDVLVFEGDVLKEPLSLAGEVEVELMVDISSTDADFIVKVIDVFPDNFSWYTELGEKARTVRFQSYPMAGYQFMVRGEVMRGKYRESFAKPVPFEPGKTTKVRFTMPDVRHTFKPGHRLMIQVQSSWFPLVDRNPQTFCDIYNCDASAFTKAQINIHCGQDAASYVKLPVVK